MRVRPPAQRGVGQRGQPDRRRVAQPGGQRRAAGDLVARRVRLGGDRERAGRADPRPGRHPVHAHAAGHRDAPADGRGPRLAGRAARLRRPRPRWPRTPRAGPLSATRSGARSGWARPTRTTPRAGSTSPSPSTTRRPARRAGLTTEDLARPAAVDFATQIESAVVHYGDITMTFLNNWFAADVRGTALTYASAVAVEEKSVIDYNLGNPDGVLSPGEEPAVPRDPAGRDLSGGGDALLRQPVHRPRHRRGSTPTRRPRRRCSRSTSSGPRTSRRCSSSGSGRTTRRSHWPTRSSPPTASTPSSRRPSSRCRRRTCSSGSSTRGPSCARTPGSCSCSTSRARWATRAATGGPSSTSPSRRR